MNTPGRIMALDVGDARIGVALSCPMQMIAQPLTTIERASGDAMKKITTLIKENSVQLVVIGMPTEKDGTDGFQAQKVKRFARRLLKTLRENPETSAVKTTFLDERFTTAAAKRIVVDSNLKNKQYSAALDRVSAALILESFLAKTPTS